MASHFPEDFLPGLQGERRQAVIAALIPPLRSLAHGLNTPIGALTLDIGSLRRSLTADTLDLEEALDILENMAAACERLSSLTGEVFAVTDSWRA